MRSELDIYTWNRKEHFEFFSKFEEPFFGMCVNVDCSSAYKKCKKEGIPFFLYYLYLASRTVNSIENFKYRKSGNKVFIYDKINASATISRDDNTFGFSNIIHDDNLEVFIKNAQKEVERIRTGTGLMLTEIRENEVHYSAIPWANFTSLSHSRSFSSEDSCPKISFGKIATKDSKMLMPVSVHAHHALMDGYHISLFIDRFQELLNAE